MCTVSAPSVQLLKSVSGLTQKLATVLVCDCVFSSLSLLPRSLAPLPSPAFTEGNCTFTALGCYPVCMCTLCKHLGLQQVLGHAPTCPLCPLVADQKIKLAPLLTHLIKTLPVVHQKKPYDFRNDLKKKGGT